MPQWCRIFSLVSLCLMVSLTAPVSAADRANVEAFLQVTGFDVALEAIAHSAEHAPALLGQEPDDFGQDWMRVSRDVFDGPQMQRMAVDILIQTLTPDHLGHAALFYASDLGQRLVAVENASHGNDDTEAKRKEGMALLQHMGPDSDRITTIMRLLDAVDSSGQSVRAVQEVMVRFLMAASHAGALGYEIDEDTLRALIKQDEQAMLADMQAGGLASAAYTYRDISDADLAAYADALEHPTMQEVYELMNAVQYEIMANRFETLAVKLADLHPAEEL
ncbi:MAG: DUF2059 domain-containing protein [Pseudomonadota bacterium]